MTGSNPGSANGRRVGVTTVEAPLFEAQGYRRHIEKPWGWELHWTPGALPYMGKLIHIRAGHRLSLQAHESKSETWLLVSGRAKVVWDDEAGALYELELAPGRGYTCVEGRRHRLVATEECEIIEVSTPELGTTWRFDDDYGRPHETPEQRDLERRQVRK
jgi:mannose-6-phosphate isomerase-like protein (cupin superfamily)